MPIVVPVFEPDETAGVGGRVFGPEQRDTDRGSVKPVSGMGSAKGEVALSWKSERGHKRQRLSRHAAAWRDGKGQKIAPRVRECCGDKQKRRKNFQEFT